MIDPLQESKQMLREEVRARLKAMPPGHHHSISSHCRILRAQPIWLSAKSIMFFAPMDYEPSIWPLLTEAMAAGRTVALPRFISATHGYAACQVRDLSRDIVVGMFGVREPSTSCPEVPLNQLDLVLVPGLAFDARGGRLGRGKGFYDRLLSGVRGTKCGVAFDEQLVDAVPVGPHDIRLNCILTPTRWIET